MARRILIINQFARTCDAREGVKRVPVHALQKGDVLSGSGERVARTTRDAARVEVTLDKGGYRRLVHWGTHTLVGVLVSDGLNNVTNAGIMHLGKKGPGSEACCGNRRAHSTSSLENFGKNPDIQCLRCKPHYEQKLALAEKIAARARGEDGVGTPEEVAYGEGWHAARMDNPYTEPSLRASWERGKADRKLKGKFSSNYFRGETRGRRFEAPKPRTNQDYKSEKGFVAKLIDVRTGGTLARSEPHISNGEGLKRWVREEATKLIRQGKRVKAEVAIVFFDPNLV